MINTTDTTPVANTLAPASSGPLRASQRRLMEALRAVGVALTTVADRRLMGEMHRLPHSS